MKSLLPFSLLLCLHLSCNLHADETRPNILFIFSDDQALRSISAYDDTIANTPNIDRIANEGALFERSYCTNSICQPSRATILTGKFSHKHGVYGNGKGNGSLWKGDQQVFPRILSANGYQTALIGKWHLDPNPSTEFDYWAVLSGSGRQGHYYNPEFDSSDGSFQLEGYSTDVITDHSIDWLENRDTSKPFMLMCQFKAPHVPRMPPIRHIDLHSDETIPMPDNFYDDYSNRNSVASIVHMKINSATATSLTAGQQKALNITPAYGDYDPTDSDYSNTLGTMTEAQRIAWHEKFDPQNEAYRTQLANGDFDTAPAVTNYRYQRFIKDYLRIVAAIDDNVGRLLDWLDDEGLADNTIVVFSSDQGFFLGEHGYAEKRWMYEETLRMPFLIRWPEIITSGLRPDALIQNIDYGPTFLDAAHIAVPSDMQGRSLLPLFDGTAPDSWRESIYYHYYESTAYNMPRIEGVRTDRYKLIRYYQHNNSSHNIEQWELFDLQTDPNEMNSLHADPSYETILAELQSEIASLRDVYEVPYAPTAQNTVPPVANDDLVSTTQNTSVRIDVTANDDNFESNATKSSVLETFSVDTTTYTQPKNGTVTWINASNEFEYTPHNDFAGLDSFTYEIVDSEDGRNQGTVHIVIKSSQSYSNWIFDSAGISGANSGAGDDYDGDGQSNFLELATGSHPANTSDTSTVELMLNNTNQQIRFKRISDYQTRGIHYTLERSSNLSEWSNHGLHYLETVAIHGTNTEWVTYESTHSDEQLFLRLQVRTD